MYAVKSGWIGQTFALASCNDSGGRKSRTRRSKEERKAMVESFIQKYQSLNDGKFPSLNLTHKEVGGSFYTVREIFRDIIQENRVLGPSKFCSAEQKIDGNSAGFPLESVSAEPLEHLFQLAIQLDKKEDASMEPDLSDIGQHAKVIDLDAGQFPDEIQSGESDKLICTESSASKNIGVITDNPEKTNKELNLTDNGQSAQHENSDILHFVNQLGESDEAEQTELLGSESIETNKKVYLVGASADNKEYFSVERNLNDNGQCVKQESLDNERGNQIVKSEEVVSKESSVSGQIEAKKETELVGASTVKITNPTADVVVETFPLRHVTKSTFALDVVSGDIIPSNGGPKELETCGFGLDNDTAVLDRTNSSVNPSVSVQKAEGASEVPLSDRRCDAMTEETMPSVAITTPEIQDPATIREDAASSDRKMDSLVKMPHNETLSESTEQILEMTRSESEGSQDSNGWKVSGPTEEPISKKLVMTGTADHVERVGQTLKGSNPTLDRINLESWQGKLKASTEVEKNPLLAFLKALVKGFLKFWSE